MTKHELRKLIRTKKNEMGSGRLAGLSEDVMENLLSHPAVSAAKTILMYYSLPDEVCTHDAIDTLAERGKTILLPVVTSDEDMVLKHYSCTGDLKKGAFGIMEPAGKPFTEYDLIDVAVVPGVGFDDSNNRLGRGKGYYDRFLRKIPNAYKIGVCFGFQKLRHIPADKNDISMDEVIAGGSCE